MGPVRGGGGQWRSPPSRRRACQSARGIAGSSDWSGRGEVRAGISGQAKGERLLPGCCGGGSRLGSPWVGEGKQTRGEAAGEREGWGKPAEWPRLGWAV